MIYLNAMTQHGGLSHGLMGCLAWSKPGRKAAVRSVSTCNQFLCTLSYTLHKLLLKCVALLCILCCYLIVLISYHIQKCCIRVLIFTSFNSNSNFFLLSRRRYISFCWEKFTFQSSKFCTLPIPLSRAAFSLGFYLEKNNLCFHTLHFDFVGTVFWCIIC